MAQPPQLGEMRNPRRDYLLATIVALAASGLLAALLASNLAAIVPRSRVDELAGVAQLAQHVVVPGAGAAAITLLALALVQANIGSWLWGVSRLLFASSREGRLPGWFASLDARGVPRRAVLALALPGVALTALASLVPGLVLRLVVVSAVFVFLYLLALASYLCTPRPLARRAGAAVLFVLMAALLATRGWYLAYPAAVSLAAVGASRLRRRRRLSPSPPRARASAAARASR